MVGFENVFEQFCPNGTCKNLREEVDNSTAFDWESVFSKEAWLKSAGKGLEGMHFTVATLQNFPLNYAVKEGGNWTGRGVSFEFLEYLKEKYRFSYSVVVPEDEVLGNNASGIIGLLHNNEADVAAAFLPVVPSFWRYIKYSPSLDIGEWVVMMKRPSESASGSGLLAPFTWQVWLLILVSLTLVGPVIYSIIKIHSKLCPEDVPVVYGVYSCVWFVYGALLKQGTTLNPMTDSTRILFATWWIFITILTAFYTANLTAFLTLSQFTLPINKATDIGTKRYTWVTKRGNMIEEALSNEKDGLSKDLQGSYGRYIKEESDAILTNYIKERQFIYIGEKPIVEHLMFRHYQTKASAGAAEDERCTFVVTKWALLSHPRAFGYSSQFAYSEVFDSTLQNLVEAGIVKYWLRDGLPNAQICPLNLKSKERQLRNTDLLLTYYIVACGFGVATLVFLSELVLRLLAGGRKQKQEQPLPPQPPPYHTLFGFAEGYEKKAKKWVNGRQYWVVKNQGAGPAMLVPVRSPSALLFQYTN